MKGKGVRWANIGIWLIALGFSGCLSWCSPCGCACTSACGGSLCSPSGCGLGGGGGGCSGGGGCGSGRSSGCSGPSLIPDATPVADASTQCVPDCVGRVCGVDRRCGEQCGFCPSDRLCSVEGQCEAIRPPSPTRLIAPLSGSRVASHRPKLQWTLGSDATSARVEVCADRECTRVTETIEGASNMAVPSELPRGVHFWRVTALRGALESARSATWEFFVGAENARSTAVLGHVFDCNGDGLADVAIGSAGRMEQSGSVDVYLGSRTQLFERPQLTLRQIHFADGFASDVASAGDYDGDGFVDLVVGSSRAVLGGDSPGATGGAFVYLGSAGGLTGTAIVLSPSRDAQQFGKTVAGLGDINLDGYGDIAVLSNHELIVYFGHSRLSAVGDFASTPAPLVMDPVRSFAAISDNDGDGRMDTLVTNISPRADGARAAWLDGDTGWHAFASSASVLTPFMSSALVAGSTGDLNGDGLADFGVGDPLDPSSPEGRGRLALFFSVGARHFAPNQVIDGPSSRSRFGWSFASAGDLDNDGFDELIVGAPGVTEERSNTDAGADADASSEDGGASCTAGYVAIHRGSATGIASAPSWTFRGGRDQCSTVGANVSFVGDLNGDGFGDVLVGDPYARVSGLDRAGRVFVVFGSPTLDALPSRTIDGTTSEQRLGAVIAGGQ